MESVLHWHTVLQHHEMLEATDMMKPVDNKMWSLWCNLSVQFQLNGKRGRGDSSTDNGRRIRQTVNNYHSKSSAQQLALQLCNRKGDPTGHKWSVSKAKRKLHNPACWQIPSLDRFYYCPRVNNYEKEKHPGQNKKCQTIFGENL